MLKSEVILRSSVVPHSRLRSAPGIQANTIPDPSKRDSSPSILSLHAAESKPSAKRVAPEDPIERLRCQLEENRWACVTLPEDALAEILRRLPPRSLATSRCVCKAWRAIVDSRQLLLPELLPHSVRGIFIMCRDLHYPLFLSHPSTDPEILGKLDFYRDPYAWSTASVLGHCNGLLLYEDERGLHVANPATQRRAHLPPPPPFWGLWWYDAHLVFDPTESPHYEVFLVPANWFRGDPYMERREQLTDEEWPPSTWVLCVFSSRTGKWEERAFVREGEAAGMASDKALQRYDSRRSCSHYWKGVLFAQCNGGFAVMRISLSNNKHKVIKMPTDIEEFDDVYLGRSKEELCCATFHWEKLRVWILDDSCGTMGWRLKHRIDIRYTISHLTMFEENEGPWKLQDANNVEVNDQQNLQDVSNNEDVNNNAPVKSKVEWDSDNDNIIDLESDDGVNFVGVLGFHPYKDVIFLNLALGRAVAYHLNTSVVQDLGKVCPDDYGGHAAELVSSFLYTPCLMAEFPRTN